MPLPVTATTAAAVALITVFLSFRIVRLRRSRRIGLGDGGDTTLRRAIRGHANLAEHAPLAVILIGICELQGTPPWLLSSLGLALVIGRVLHPWGLAGSSGISFGRTAGTALTWLVLMTGAVIALGGALR